MEESQSGMPRTTTSLGPRLPPKRPALPRAWPPQGRATREGQDATDTAHLHVHEELPEVSRRQHDGGVELDDVALVQGDVMVGGQTLRRRGRVGPCGRGPGPGGAAVGPPASEGRGPAPAPQRYPPTPDSRDPGRLLPLSAPFPACVCRMCLLDTRHQL